MQTPPPVLRFDTTFVPETGRAVPVAPAIVRVTAPNAGPYTFTGTNSFLLGTRRLLLVDPGPDDSRHREALEAAIAGRTVEAILLTHTHRDHCALARTMADRLDAPLWFGGSHRLSRPALKDEINAIAQASDWALQPDRTLHDGETIAIPGLTLEVIATPGHCADHLVFGIVGQDALLSGDHVMGWNSTLVSVPDGSMTDYLTSLDRLIAAPYRFYLPAHGGPIADGPGYAEALKAHRLARNAQIVAAVTSGASSIGAITAMVYPGLAPSLLPAARMTVAAHVEHLELIGAVQVRDGRSRTRIFPPS